MSANAPGMSSPRPARRARRAGSCVIRCTANAIGTKDIGIATSLLVVTRVIGVALGAQIAAAILDAGAASVTGLPSESAFVTGFTVTGLVAALSLLFVHITKKGTQA